MSGHMLYHILWRKFSFSLVYVTFQDSLWIIGLTPPIFNSPRISLFSIKNIFSVIVLSHPLTFHIVLFLFRDSNIFNNQHHYHKTTAGKTL